MRREYPLAPLPSVGAVVRNGDKVLLVLRGQEPSRGKWSIPGGMMELGETIRETARREVREECGVEIEAGEVIEVRDAIVRDEAGRIRFHYVLVDVIARHVSGDLRAGSDVEDARWVSRDDLTELELSPGLLPLLLSCLEMGDLDFPEYPG
jgi:8-oxo-dGTP diphosphatase